MSFIIYYRLDVKQITEYLQRTICLVCKYLLCKYLTKLNTFLIEAVDVPQESLEHNLVLEMCKQCTKCLWIKLLTDNDRRWTTTLEVLVAVLILLTTCKCYDLCSNICAELLLACASLNLYIRADLAVLECDKLQWNNVSSLMQ